MEKYLYLEDIFSAQGRVKACVVVMMLTEWGEGGRGNWHVYYTERIKKKDKKEDKKEGYIHMSHKRSVMICASGIVGSPYRH